MGLTIFSDPMPDVTPLPVETVLEHLKPFDEDAQHDRDKGEEAGLRITYLEHIIAQGETCIHVVCVCVCVCVCLCVYSACMCVRVCLRITYLEHMIAQGETFILYCVGGWVSGWASTYTHTHLFRVCVFVPPNYILSPTYHRAGRD